MEFQLLAHYKLQVAGHACSLFSALLIDSPTTPPSKRSPKTIAQKKPCFMKRGRWHVPMSACQNTMVYLVRRSVTKSTLCLRIYYQNINIRRSSISNWAFAPMMTRLQKTNEKKMIRKSQLTTSKSLFFRISGMKVFLLPSL